uniref:acyl-CoA dehydrogenase family protein n=1 Tax=Streptomyces sp. wa1063 TaxID=1828212 RepID=UPI001180F3B7
MTAPAQPPATPDLLYSQDEEDLRAAVRALLADRADAPTVIAATESDTPYDQRLWSSLATGIGAAGLLVPEKLGGQGASHREAAVVLEELGRSVAPAPYLTSSVVATETLLALGGEDGPAAALLGELASGARTAVLAVPFATPPAGAAAALTSRDGTVRGVADAAVADVLLVPTAEGLYAVEAADPGVAVRPLVPLDLTRPLAAVTLTGAAGTLLADAGASAAAVRRLSLIHISERA